MRGSAGAWRARAVLSSLGSGRVALKFSIRWPDIAGLHKVKRGGVTQAFGVRSRAGAQLLFREDLPTVEWTLERWLRFPSEREMAREVPSAP